MNARIVTVHESVWAAFAHVEAPVGCPNETFMGVFSTLEKARYKVEWENADEDGVDPGTWVLTDCGSPQAEWTLVSKDDPEQPLGWVRETIVDGD